MYDIERVLKKEGIINEVRCLRCSFHIKLNETISSVHYFPVAFAEAVDGTVASLRRFVQLRENTGDDVCIDVSDSGSSGESSRGNGDDSDDCDDIADGDSDGDSDRDKDEIGNNVDSDGGIDGDGCNCNGEEGDFLYCFW